MNIIQMTESEDNVNKALLLYKVDELTDTAFNAIEQLLEHPFTSLDELVQRLSPVTDRMVLEIEHTESLIFIGGMLVISFQTTGKEQFHMFWKLCFQNKVGELVLKEKRKNLNFLDLNIQEKQDLKNEKIIEYDIKPRTTITI